MIQLTLSNIAIAIFLQYCILTLPRAGMYNPFSHHWQGSIDFNTVRTTRPTGMYFLIHP